MKHISILSLLSLLFIFSSCPKNGTNPTTNPQLPPATQTGANTFGCLVNGKVWLPNRNNGPSLEVQYYRGLFLLTAANQKDSQSVSWAYQTINALGTYYFKSAPITGGGSGSEFYDINSNCDFKSNIKDSINTYITITKLDSLNRIISGTFNMIYLPAINTMRGTCDTVKITNGRFDAKYFN